METKGGGPREIGNVRMKDRKREGKNHRKEKCR
jgi:hypothetical protein